MVSADALCTHVDYSRWASRRLLEAGAALRPDELDRDFETADRSFAGTLVHIFGGDRVWLARVAGGVNTGMPGSEFGGLEALGPAWDEVHQGWIDWAGALGEHDVDRLISYQDLKGRPWRTPVWQIVLHVVNHATHHRGQAAGFLRAMGHRPPPLDLIAYYRSLGLTAAG
jgi:uncharacterized damage-inducible protein DinB